MTRVDIERFFKSKIDFKKIKALTIYAGCAGTGTVVKKCKTKI